MDPMEENLPFTYKRGDEIQQSVTLNLQVVFGGADKMYPHGQNQGQGKKEQRIPWRN
jgi:hypothetical protein